MLRRLLRKIFKRPPRVHPLLVSMDEERIRLKNERDGAEKSVLWNDLLQIVVETTDEGPWLEDMYYIFYTTSEPLVVPSESRGVSELVSKIAGLPGFDQAQYFAAVGSTDNKQFLVWKK